MFDTSRTRQGKQFTGEVNLLEFVYEQFILIAYSAIPLYGQLHFIMMISSLSISVVNGVTVYSNHIDSIAEDVQIFLKCFGSSDFSAVLLCGS